MQKALHLGRVAIALLKKRAKETFECLNKKDDIVLSDDYFRLSAGLMEISDTARNSIIAIASMLNRSKNDSFYIPYSLLKEYEDYQIDWDGGDPSRDTLDFKKKDEELFLSANLMKNSIENKPFIDAVYNMIRYGEAPCPGNRDMKIYANWIFSQFHMIFPLKISTTMRYYKILQRIKKSPASNVKGYS